MVDGREGAARPEDITRLFAERAKAKDAEGLAALYEDDAVLAFPPGQMTQGRAAIRALYEKMLAQAPEFEPGGTVAVGDHWRPRAHGDRREGRGGRKSPGRPSSARWDLAADTRPPGLSRLAVRRPIDIERQRESAREEGTFFTSERFLNAYHNASTAPSPDTPADLASFMLAADPVLVEAAEGAPRARELPTRLLAERGRRQQNSSSILARSLAAQLATAVFLVDAEGTVIYFNEAAERLLGQRFIEGAGMAAEEWSTRYRPRDSEGHTVPLESLPLGVTMLKRESAHGILTILGADGVDRGSRLWSSRCSPAWRTSWAPSRCSGSGRKTGRCGEADPGQPRAYRVA